MELSEDQKIILDAVETLSHQFTVTELVEHSNALTNAFTDHHLSGSVKLDRSYIGSRLKESNYIQESLIKAMEASHRIHAHKKGDLK